MTAQFLEVLPALFRGPERALSRKALVTMASQPPLSWTKPSPERALSRKALVTARWCRNRPLGRYASRKGTQPKGIGDLRSGCVSFSFFVLVPKGPPAEEHWSSRMGSLRMIVGPLTLSKRMNQRTCWHIAPGDDVGHQVRLIAKKKNPRSADCFFPPAPRPAPNQPARRRISPATERRGWHEPNHKL